MKTVRTLAAALAAVSLLGVAACGEITGGEQGEDSEQSEGGGESEDED
jgi:hypothetical protein